MQILAQRIEEIEEVAFVFNTVIKVTDSLGYYTDFEALH